MNEWVKKKIAVPLHENEIKPDYWGLVVFPT